MKNILSLGTVCALTISLSACTSPDRCIKDLDCGVGAYSEERTVGGYEPKTMKTSPVKEAPVMEAKTEMMEDKAPAPAAPVEEPVQGTADAMFDERLTK